MKSSLQYPSKRNSIRLSLTSLLFLCFGLVSCGPPHESAHDHDDGEVHDDHHNDDHDEHDDDHHDGEHMEDDHDDGAHDEADKEHQDHGDDTVSVSDEVLREFGIVFAEAGPGILHEEVILPGEIQFNREKMAFVSPQYAGTVKKIAARLADAIKEGQVLATLESTETLLAFEIKAPFGGTVVGYDITPGETVQAGESLFTVADLSTVWADLRVYQRDLNKINKGQRVVIVDGHDGPTFTGEISYIAPTIDEHTRTGLARVVVNNESGDWRPGQFITGNVFLEGHEEEVVVPRSAILPHEGQTVVFVKTADGFEPRPVLLGHGDALSVAIEDGLVPGEIYVERNAISLKAEMSKGSFGGHAGHVH